MRPVDDVDRGALRRQDEVDADGARHLGQARDGSLDLLAGRHHQVRELVHDHDDVGQVAVALVVGELPGGELLVVVLEPAHARTGEEVVAPLHLLLAALQKPPSLG